MLPDHADDRGGAVLPGVLGAEALLQGECGAQPAGEIQLLPDLDPLDRAVLLHQGGVYDLYQPVSVYRRDLSGPVRDPAGLPGGGFFHRSAGGGDGGSCV